MKHYSNRSTCTFLMLSLLTAHLFSSCDNGADCPLNNVSYARYAFYNAGGEAVQLADTLTVYLRINGEDSVVVNRSISTASLQLPVCYTQTTDTLIFGYSGPFTDTVYVHHTNIPYFISMDCGMAMYHRIEKITATHTYIDSIGISEPYISYDEKTNIKIFFAD